MAINCYKCPDSNFAGVTCTEDSSYIGDAEECSSNSMWCKKTQSKSSAKFDNRKYMLVVQFDLTPELELKE